MTRYPEPHVEKRASFKEMLWLIFALEFVVVYLIGKVIL